VFKAPHVIPAPDEISDGFIFNGRYIDAGQFTSTKQPDQVDGITAIRLDSIATSLRDHRRGNHGVVDVFRAKVPVNLIAAWPGFIYKSELRVVTV
jgi:hypothetical protein